MAEKKIKVDAEVLSALHKKLKDSIKNKAKNDNETKGFIRTLLTLYEDTVEVAIRENVVICERENEMATSNVKQEMEPLDNARAKEVNEMCGKAEDLLVSTIKKRKIYPQKIKESLRMKHDAEMMNLQNLEKKIREEKSYSGSKDMQFDMTECEDSLTRLKSACEDLTQSSQSLSDTTGKFERYNTVEKLKLKMENNELHRALFGERKLPSSFDSILASPTKKLRLDETVTDSDNKMFPTLWHNQQNKQLKKLKDCKRKKSPDSTSF